MKQMAREDEGRSDGSEQLDLLGMTIEIAGHALQVRSAVASRNYPSRAVRSGEVNQRQDRGSHEIRAVIELWQRIGVQLLGPEARLRAAIRDLQSFEGLTQQGGDGAAQRRPCDYFVDQRTTRIEFDEMMGASVGLVAHEPLFFGERAELVAGGQNLRDFVNTQHVRDGQPPCGTESSHRSMMPRH